MLYPMLTGQNSPYQWCVCIAKSHPNLAEQSLDALFRLLFIAAGKATENNSNRGNVEWNNTDLRGIGDSRHSNFG